MRLVKLLNDFSYLCASFVYRCLKMEGFDIEFVKLKNGIHHFEYQFNVAFFYFFKNQDINSARVTVKVSLDKLDTLLRLDINGEGKIGLVCDRCLSDVEYPVNNHFKVIYHLNAIEDKIDEAQEVNLDIFYLSGSQFKINIAESIYQSFLTEIPMVKRCDDIEGEECSTEMLDALGSLEDSKKVKNEIDPRWEELKKLLNKKEK